MIAKDKTFPFHERPVRYAFTVIHIRQVSVETNWPQPPR